MSLGIVIAKSGVDTPQPTFTAPTAAICTTAQAFASRCSTRSGVEAADEDSEHSHSDEQEGDEEAAESILHSFFFLFFYRRIYENRGTHLNAVRLRISSRSSR